MPVRKRKRHRDYTSRLARQAGVDATEQTSRVFAPEGKRLPDIAEPLIYSQPLISVLPMRVRYLERIIKGHAYECANRPGKQTALALGPRVGCQAS